MGRRFNNTQREIIWNNNRGICGICQRKVRGNWQADHIYPWSLGGETIVENGQVSHPYCNQQKYNNPDYSNIGWNRNWRVWLEYWGYW